MEKLDMKIGIVKNRHRCLGHKARFLILLVLGLLFAAGANLFAQTNLTINATVSARAELTLSPATISFPDASPTVSPTIPANSTVSVTANVRTGATSTPTLTVLANGDLTSGGSTIGINNISWTASGAPFIAGTMNKTTAQSAATFNQGSGSRNGTYSYTLANSWDYATGSYTQTATYTLTAP
jgi:hypothetical protein